MLSARHPSNERLRAFSQGHVSAIELTAIESHLQNCPACCALLEETADDDPFVSQLRCTAQASERLIAAGAVSEPRETCDRVRSQSIPADSSPTDATGWPTIPGFEIVNQLGCGGMG